MCVDEQRQYQKHLLAFSSGSKPSLYSSSSSSARPGARARGRGAVVFSSGVRVEPRQEGLLPSKPASAAEKEQQQKAATSAPAPDAAKPPAPSAAILPL